MPASLSADDRTKIIANNRSLRIIKNELEALAERDFITDEQYETILKALPAEASLHNASSPQPSRSTTATSVTDGFAAMSVNDRNSTNATTPKTQTPSFNAPAPLPPRNPPQQPQHKEIAHVVALYRYHDPDPRDLNFETGDHISVTEYCNPEWWQGKNARTGEEGIFPKNYVRQENTPSALAQLQPQQSYNNEKAGGYMYGGSPQPPQPMGGYYPGQQHQQPPPPGPSNPYDGPVPPMQVADQPTEHQPGKGAEMGKKFGKKLGNAAIFGAGATIGSNIVSSIF